MLRTKSHIAMTFMGTWELSVFSRTLHTTSRSRITKGVVPQALSEDGSLILGRRNRNMSPRTGAVASDGRSRTSRQTFRCTWSEPGRPSPSFHSYTSIFMVPSVVSLPDGLTPGIRPKARTIKGLYILSVSYTHLRAHETVLD